MKKTLLFCLVTCMSCSLPQSPFSSSKETKHSSSTYRSEIFSCKKSIALHTLKQTLLQQGYQIIKEQETLGYLYATRGEKELVAMLTTLDEKRVKIELKLLKKIPLTAYLEGVSDPKEYHTLFQEVTRSLIQ